MPDDVRTRDGGSHAVHPVPSGDTDHQLDEELAGLDALELAGDRGRPWWARLWSSMWPKLAAIAIGLLVWQIVVWSGWKEPWVLPGPVPVFQKLFEDIADGTVFDAIGLTMRRAAAGFALATVVGGLIGIAVARVRVLRVAVGSLITGLQTMPSIAWFPLAILLFKLSESAILFVIVLGAAPSIANGIISGIDTVPPLLDRVGTVLGASGFRRLRHVVIPAALPQVVAGMKQGWAFAWRSLMAGELLVIIANKPSIGTQLQNARDLADTTWLISVMIVILVIGIVIDTIFGTVERTLLRRRGLASPR